VRILGSYHPFNVRRFALGGGGSLRGSARRNVRILTFGCTEPPGNRVRNKHKQKPVDIADPRDKELRGVLQKGEYMMTAGDDVVKEDDDYEGTGSGSESD
jgi:hypothetical protein